MVSVEKPAQSGSNPYRWMELAVPLLSFGGALVAILLQIQGNSLDFRYSVLGCVLASGMLAYLAWIRTKKDIVALSTPIYSFMFFVVPTDYSTGIMLELLYAASLTILLVRLKYRFGEPGTAVSLGKVLADPLKTYVEQTSAALIPTDTETAHRATLVFVRFAQGEYGEAARLAASAADYREATGPAACLARAFGIVEEHAVSLDASLPRPESYRIFTPEDAGLLAKPTAPARDEDLEFYATLDNALLLVFSAAWNASGQDRPHLLACQQFAQKLMSEK